MTPSPLALALVARRSVVEIAAYMNDVAIVAKGEYRLQLFVDGEFVMERRLMIYLEANEP